MCKVKKNFLKKFKKIELALPILFFILHYEKSYLFLAGNYPVV